MLRRLNTENRSYVNAGGGTTDCAGKDCPAVYELTESPAIVRVQGRLVTNTEGLENFNPSSEAAVEIPTAVLLEAAARLAR